MAKDYFMAQAPPGVQAPTQSGWGMQGAKVLPPVAAADFHLSPLLRGVGWGVGQYLVNILQYLAKYT